MASSATTCDMTAELSPHISALPGVTLQLLPLQFQVMLQLSPGLMSPCIETSVFISSKTILIILAEISYPSNRLTHRWCCGVTSLLHDNDKSS